MTKEQQKELIKELKLLISQIKSNIDLEELKKLGIEISIELVDGNNYKNNSELN